MMKSLENLIEKLFRTPVQNKIISNRAIDNIGLCGIYEFEHYNSKGKLLNKFRFKNGITNVGKNLLLNAMFNDATAVANSAWCIGLVDNAGSPVLNASDTMASHSGWTEAVGYSQSTRPALGSTTATAQSTANASPVQFDFTTSAVIYGIFITSVNTKSGTTGVLWSTGAFPTGNVSVASSDTIRVNYSLSC